MNLFKIKIKKKKILSMQILSVLSKVLLLENQLLKVMKNYKIKKWKEM